jgi:hypothetical protein
MYKLGCWGSCQLIYKISHHNVIEMSNLNKLTQICRKARVQAHGLISQIPEALLLAKGTHQG